MVVVLVTRGEAHFVEYGGRRPVHDVVVPLPPADTTPDARGDATDDATDDEVVAVIDAATAGPSEGWILFIGEERREAESRTPLRDLASYLDEVGADRHGCPGGLRSGCVVAQVRDAAGRRPVELLATGADDVDRLGCRPFVLLSRSSSGTEVRGPAVGPC